MTSFAETVSASPINSDSPRREFEHARDGRDTQKETRSPSMVEREKPHPAPRPSPGFAADADRAAFDAAWEREQRRAAFIAMRTDPDTGGRVRSEQNFNR